MVHWWNKTDRGKPKHSAKTLSHWHCFHQTSPHRLFSVVCAFVQLIIPTIMRISQPQPRYGVGCNPSLGSLAYMPKPNKLWPTKYEAELKRFKNASNKCDGTPRHFIPIHSHKTCSLTWI